MEKHVFEYIQGGNPAAGMRKITVEVGQLAKQANASCLVRYNDTAVLSAVVLSPSAVNIDYLPLNVFYQEKLYAAGKIPGSFLRREGRPSEQETLIGRLIDRPLRPLFPEGFRNELQAINMVMCSDPNCSAAMTAMLGSSIAFSISEIPFDGPIAGVIVGRVDGELIINPTVEQMEKSDINLTVSGTEDAINMVEAGAKEVSEDDMLDALMFAHAEIKKMVAFEKEIIAAIGKPKADFQLFDIPEEITNEVNEYASSLVDAALAVTDKVERDHAVADASQQTVQYIREKYAGTPECDLKTKHATMLMERLIAEKVRRRITVDKVRPDGRAVDEIRPLSSMVDVFARTHGSAMFTRGQTQVVSIVTLGTLNEYQIIDGLGVEESKRFMHHYNFPQFCVGSIGKYGSPRPREVGHGALGERALFQVIPSEDEFPYTIRVVSEVLESNGSSSQASICASTMALMAAGVPIKSPVAGIAMGLISDGTNYTILTDIQGLEDHYGDMDFKVAGTSDGITALQMDIKIRGVTRQILSEALAQAKKARFQILDHMSHTIPAVRKELSPYAPKVKLIRINPEKIRDIIGTGGKIIQDIIKECNEVKIDIEQDGRVFVAHSDVQWIDKAIAIIEKLTKEAKVGEIYKAVVVKNMKFGCFVELWPGYQGLVHISNLDTKRVAKVEDVVKEGDEIIVKVIGFEDNGKVQLSRKDALINNTPKEN